MSLTIHDSKNSLILKKLEYSCWIFMLKDIGFHHWEQSIIWIPLLIRKHSIQHTGMEQVCFHQPGKNLETWKTCLKRVGAKYSKNSIILKKYRIFMLKVKFDSNISIIQILQNYNTDRFLRVAIITSHIRLQSWYILTG